MTDLARRGGLLIVLLALAPQALAVDSSDEQDVVEFEGGNRLVGEIKQLERGRLHFETSATDTISMDWNEVTRLVTPRRLRLEDAAGKRILGSLAESATSGVLVVVGEDGTAEVPIASIVNIDPIEETAWERTDMKVSAGYSFTKSTGVRQWNADLEVENETEDQWRALSLSSQSTGSDGEDDSRRDVAGFETFVLRRDLWLSGWLLGAEQNDALDLDLRLVAAFGGGRRFFPHRSQRGFLFGGLQVNQERFAEAGSHSSLEAVLYGRFDWYRFKEPELDLFTTLRVQPGLTEFGRYRTRFEISLEWEFVSDVFWQLTFYDDYDSDPFTGRDESTPTNDYGITTGIGWSH